MKETYINRALRRLGGKTYLEIGVRDGVCLRQIDCERKIAVDPVRTPAMLSLRQEEIFFEKESNQFFEYDAPGLFQHKQIDVAFVDGLHTFEQALMDILHCESFMRPDGAIFVHDCNPITRQRCEVRDGGPWNGDVWKVAKYLADVRGDLNFFTIDCDEGLGVITGFTPGMASVVNADQIAEYKGLDYSVLDADRAKILNLQAIENVRQEFETLISC